MLTVSYNKWEHRAKRWMHKSPLISGSFCYFEESWMIRSCFFYLYVLKQQCSTWFSDLTCMTFVFLSTVPYRILQTQVEATAQTRARALPDPHPPGLCPEEAHTAGPSGAPVAKLPAVTLQPHQVDLQRLSSRSRILLSSALSTCSLCLSEFDTGLLICGST